MHDDHTNEYFVMTQLQTMVTVIKGQFNITLQEAQTVYNTQLLPQ